MRFCLTGGNRMSALGRIALGSTAFENIRRALTARLDDLIV